MPKIMSILVILGSLLCNVPAVNTQVPSITFPLVSLNGSDYSVAFQKHEKALVFVFLSVDCPIANRCLPELHRLQQEFATNGVRFLHIYASHGETDDAIKRHRQEFSLNGEPFRDPDHKLAKRFGARTTPEAVAIAADGKLIYQGRVNNQFVSLGKGKPAPTQHDLSDALKDFIVSNRAKATRTKAVGCTFCPEP